MHVEILSFFKILDIHQLNTLKTNLFICKEKPGKIIKCANFNTQKSK